MKKTSIIALFAHPDDETMLSGGTLALLANRGVPVHYVCATRGEGGEMGKPPAATRERLGEVRTQEMECAVNALGGSSLMFMGYTDPLVGPDDTLYPFDVEFEILVQQIQDRIDAVGATALITHGSNGEYGHPAHLLIHRAAVEAVKRNGAGVTLYTVQAAFDDHPKPRVANKDDKADLVIDVTPVLDQKTQAARCHRSQHALFIRRTSEDLGRTVDVSEVVMKVESLHRVRTNTTDPGDDALLALLRQEQP